VLDQALVLNPDGLRFPDEFVRHKVLDALGDFKLAGIHLQGYFRLHRAGHDLHSQLIAAILKDPDCYEIIDGNQQVEERRSAQLRPIALARAAAV
jgi:UDP-3-O-[3-hydroxymyristoyl] N-acetylglucosamine deacetylase